MDGSRAGVAARPSIVHAVHVVHVVHEAVTRKPRPRSNIPTPTLPIRHPRCPCRSRPVPRRSGLPARIVHVMPAFRPLSFALLLSLAAPAGVDAASVTAEQPLSAPVYGAADGDQTNPSIASDGSNYLVVWDDGRARSSGMYAARVSASGELLDHTGIRFGGGGELWGQGVSTVVWSGSSYMVFWEDQQARAIRMARIASDGTVIESSRTLVENAYAITSRFAASNESRTVLGFQRQEPGGGSSLHLAVLDREGQIQGEQEIPLLYPNSHSLTVTTNGSSFLAVWASYDGRDVRLEAVGLDSNGVIDDASRKAVTGFHPTHDGPVVGSDGEDYLVLLREVPGEELRAVRIGAGAASVSGAHFVGAPAGVTVSNPRLTWTGGDYLLLWEEGQALRLDRDGVARSSEPVTLDAPDGHGVLYHAAAAFAGAQGLVVWVDSRLSHSTWSPRGVVGATLDPSSLAIGDPELLSISAPRQTAPSVAYGGARAIAAWNEDTGVYISRIAPDGSFLDGRGIHIAEPSSYYTRTPRVIYDGTGYLLAWIDSGTGLRYTRIAAAEGQPIPGSSGILTDCAVDFAIAAGDDGSLIVWPDCRSWDLLAVRMGSSGHPIDTIPLEIASGMDPAASPAIAWSGSQWLVAWEEWIEVPLGYQFPVYRKVIRAARVTRELTLLDHGGLPLGPSEDEQHSNVAPAVASDGAGFVVVWGSDERYGRTREVRARQVGPDATMGDLDTISSGSDPAITWTGDRYLVAWEERRNIMGAWLATDGELLSAAFAIAATSDDEGRIMLTPVRRGRAAATYSRVATEPLYGGVERVFQRFINSGQRARPVRRP